MKKDARLLVLAADSCINIATAFASFRTHSFYNCEKKMLFTDRNLYDRVTRQKAMNGVEPVSFFELLNFTLENMATYMSQGMKVLQQYLIVIRIFN